MKRFLPFVTCVLLLFGSNASAAVFERDWKTPGDGLLTYDDVNQREWLDLKETLLGNWGRYPANIVSELGIGGFFHGFDTARPEDVMDLARSAGIDPTTLDFAVNNLATAALIDLLTDTIESGQRSLGLVVEYVRPTYSFPDQSVLNVFVSSAEHLAGINSFSFSEMTSDRPFSIVGMFLYRGIPEPSGFALSMLVVSVWSLCRARTREL
jgi:hypothetical protein